MSNANKKIPLNITFVNYLRKKKGLTIETLANLIGISRISVQGWLNGKIQPTPDNLNKLADFFGVHPDILVESDKKKTHAYLRENLYEFMSKGLPELDMSGFIQIMKTLGLDIRENKVEITLNKRGSTAAENQIMEKLANGFGKPKSSGESESDS